jgi:hypothetical protein
MPDAYLINQFDAKHQTILGLKCIPAIDNSSLRL